MRVCFVGAGSLGGYMAAKLALAGVETVVVERGAHRVAMEERGGLTLIEGDTEAVDVSIPVLAMTELGGQDLIVLGVKAMDLAAVAPGIEPLLTGDTSVMTIQNGIPWWYFHGLRGPLAGTRLETLDPSGVLERSIPSDRIIGCPAYPAAVKVEPGVVKLTSAGRFPIGSIDGEVTSRLGAVYELFESAGLRSRILDDVRSELWLKALGSLSFNPVSALTSQTMAGMCQDPRTRRLIETMMEEAWEVATRLGVRFRRTIEERLAGAEKVGDHKTSMLQSMERGERLEVDALVNVMSELGHLVDVDTPTIDLVGSLVTALDREIARAADGNVPMPS